MWYAIQTISGSEEETVENIRKMVDREVCEDCFLLKREAVWRIQGACRVHIERLFPGYVFLDSDKLTQLYMDLKQVSGLTKLLKTGDEVIPLSKEEVGFLQSFGGAEQVVVMSEGVIENSKVRVISGPLVGKEGFIKRIDRHKRKAFLEMEMFGRVQKVQVGLEIISKI